MFCLVLNYKHTWESFLFRINTPSSRRFTDNFTDCFTNQWTAKRLQTSSSEAGKLRTEAMTSYRQRILILKRVNYKDKSFSIALKRVYDGQLFHQKERLAAALSQLLVL